MAKLSITSIQGKKAVKCRLSHEESINGRELDFLAACPTQCFMRPVMKNDKSLIFVGADGIPAAAALKSKLNKNKYFLIVAQLIEMLRSAQQYGFDLNNLVLDPKIMLINPKNSQIFMPYIPITDCETPNGGMIRCLREISTLAEFASEYDFSFADAFMCHVMSMGRFSADDADDYIREISPNTNKELAMLPNVQTLRSILHNLEQSGISLTEKQSLFQIIFGSAAIFGKPAPENIQPENNDAEHEDDDFLPHDLLDGVSESDNDDDDIFQSEQNFETHLYEEPAAERTSFERPKTETPAEPTAAAKTLKPVAPVKPVVPQMTKYPEITRRSTGQRFRIDKPVYKIGKENARVDLYVSNNPTVSRVHVHIVTRNGHFYIIDQNSTNRTFVNGIHVPPQVEYKLRDGDEIKLSNEFFDFRVEL